MSRDNLNRVINELADAIATDSANASIAFRDDVYNKGFYWAGKDYTKQLVLISGPDRIFSSETIDIAKGKELQVNGVKVLDGESLGAGVTKSNLREVGKLRGLIVDGSMSVNNYLYYDAGSDRLGLGTDSPHAGLSVAEDGVETVLGTHEFEAGKVGTFASNDFLIVTDNTARISVKANGDIVLGNKTQSPANVSVHGKVSIGINNADPRVDLDVKGNIKFGNKLHMVSNSPPDSGQFHQGDIIWNENPSSKGHVGWVCVRTGAPGLWAPFGQIV